MCIRCDVTILQCNLLRNTRAKKSILYCYHCREYANTVTVSCIDTVSYTSMIQVSIITDKPTQPQQRLQRHILNIAPKYVRTPYQIIPLLYKPFHQNKLFLSHASYLNPFIAGNRPSQRWSRWVHAPRHTSSWSSAPPRPLSRAWRRCQSCGRHLPVTTTQQQ